MQHSNDRILVTHVGSLPRSPALLDMLGQAEAGEDVDRGAFQAEVLDGLREAVREQAAAGIDIAGDGELPRIGFSFYAKDRMTGFGGVAQRGTVTDFAKFPGYAELVVSRSAGESTAGKSASVWETPECVDEVRYDPELTQAKEELDLFADALAAEPEAGGRFAGTFVTAVTPGILATTLLRNPDNPAYPRDEDYVFALARELRREYEYIVSRGHILQLDAPDLALERQILFVDRPLAEFQARMEVHVAALNEALESIPRDRVRLHVCWGNWDGPHCDDVDLESILPIIYQARGGRAVAGLREPAPCPRGGPVPRDAAARGHGHVPRRHRRHHEHAGAPAGGGQPPVPLGGRDRRPGTGDRQHGLRVLHLRGLYDGRAGRGVGENASDGGWRGHRDGAALGMRPESE